MIVGWTDLSDGYGRQGLGEAGIVAKKPPMDVSIGKFDILATYTYVQAHLHGLDPDHGGCQVHGRAVRGSGKCVFLEMKSPCG
jgi:hypothetical protein